MNNIPNIDASNNLEINLVNSYMNFINTSNNSLHHMLAIINDQQSSFDNLLHHYGTFTPSFMPSFMPSVRSVPYVSPYNRFSTISSNNSFVRSSNRSTIPSTTIPQINRLETNSFRRGSYLSQRIQDILASNLSNSVLQDIPNQNIRPSQEQIDVAIERTLYKDILTPINYSCPISQVDFSDNDTVILLKECRHIFSVTSILQWFERDSHCPLCRYDIRNNVGINTNEEGINPLSSTILPFTD